MSKISRFYLFIIITFSVVFDLRGQKLTVDKGSYEMGEEVKVIFNDGPGNPLDWVGIFEETMITGEILPLAWFYMNGSQEPGDGLDSGRLSFGEGFNKAGTYEARYFSNDGYELLAKATFEIGNSDPHIKVSKRKYYPAEPITIEFVNGPGNSADWIGLYKSQDLPAGGSLDWFYIGGSKEPSNELKSGSVTFPEGLLEQGDYKAILHINDSTRIIDERPFSVRKGNPYLFLSQPLTGEMNSYPEKLFVAVIRNDNTQLDHSSVVLTLDGTEVDANVVYLGEEDLPNYILNEESWENQYSLVYFQGTSNFKAGTTHTYKLEYSDNGKVKKRETVTINFEIAEYKMLDLPSPIYYEDFDSVDSFTLPKGWEVHNFTKEMYAEYEFQNYESKAYEGWVNLYMWNWLFSPYWPQKSENPSSYYFVNNERKLLDFLEVFNPAIPDKALVADSASRWGSYITFLYTNDYNLSGY